MRNVTDMHRMFEGAAAFNGDLSGWDVRNVTNMGGMFRGAAAFNGDLSGWDVRNVTNMGGMFVMAAAFNGDLSCWDVRHVTDMAHHVCGRLVLQRRPERLGRAQRHEHGRHVSYKPRPSTAT